MQNHEKLEKALAKYIGQLNAENGRATDEFIAENAKEIGMQVSVVDFKYNCRCTAPNSVMDYHGM
jgi:predicted ATPase